MKEKNAKRIQVSLYIATWKFVKQSKNDPKRFLWENGERVVVEEGRDDSTEELRCKKAYFYTWRWSLHDVNPVRVWSARVTVQENCPRGTREACSSDEAAETGSCIRHAVVTMKKKGKKCARDIKIGRTADYGDPILIVSGLVLGKLRYPGNQMHDAVTTPQRHWRPQ
jgi:hypothetical protein